MDADSDQADSSDPLERKPRRRTPWRVSISRGPVNGRVPRTAINRALDRVGRGERLRGEVRVVVVGNRQMRQLNRRFRKKDRATDVLAFPGGPAFPSPTGLELIGEIYCNLDHAQRWSRDHGGTRAAEMARLAMHGCLHLLGYRHRTDIERRRMMAREDRYLKQAGLLSVRTTPQDDNGH
jgi:probable rRNA maturation factor